ncbi:collagen alpha-1(XVIII) chain isoform X1 [Drosophila sechellia]|uniref:collagen alpha-1(XVIII) chain isoform X1 n=1 Tax=Drosophila sechellia TaxID=7238 RepID=UPI0013DDA4FA|nr:collagen alpha-1(XVIII) chain isoform X1 [Drosophila sechellia]
MFSRRVVAFAALALILIASGQASQFSRDESQEDQKTEFNLASTLTGGITSSRHRQRANLNSQLYPSLGQLGSGYAGATGSIDDAHGHEQGGSGVRVASTNSVVFPGNQSPNPALTITGGQQFPAYPPPGFPGQQAPVPYPASGSSSGGAPSSGGYQSAGGVAPLGYPVAGAVPAQYPVGVPPQQPVGTGAPGYFPGTGAYPGYPYPGVYLQQYPAYPQPAQFPAYGVVPGAVAQPGVPGVAGVPGVQGVAGVPGAPGVAGVPGAAGQAPVTSGKNYHRYPAHNPADPSHWDHHFSMNTEYKEDGVHKGPFGVLNNHNAFGYGSGYGGGYNGAFNSPSY